MSGKAGFLLDTNIVIALFNNEQAVHSNLQEDVQVYLSSIVLGELYYGVERSVQINANRKRIHALKESVIVLHVNEETAEHYGKLKARLKTKGTPLPENDIWIAAISSQYQLTLATRDRHFELIEGLSMIHW